MRVNLESNDMYWVDYDPVNYTLTISFRNPDEVIKFNDVSREKYEGLISAGDNGGTYIDYYRQNIKGRYSEEKAS